ncbi:MAG: hypothetical protein B7Y39_12385 [Bdellovibrio sp. 28-41-41]|nr:MAG: hypothetical protein B7Y39_12385 [Bdellovibrio sp. 28-41-41]
MFRGIAAVAGTDNTIACPSPAPMSVPSTIQKWTSINKGEGAAVKTMDKKGAYCELYSKSQAGAHVQSCVTEDGSKALNANDVIWGFFKALP